METTNEFSFMLKASKHGVGVFAVHDIGLETYLRLFGNEDKEADVSVIRNKKDIPEFLIQTLRPVHFLENIF